MIKKLILTLYQTNTEVIRMQCDGLTHEDSLLQLPFQGNCLNWVVGHMVASREANLVKLGQQPVWTAEETARYNYDSEPITSPDDPTIIPFERILADLKIGLARLEAGLEAISEEELVKEDEKGRSLASSIHFGGWHGGYHSGQTEYLRQLAGKNDKVI